MDFKEYRTGGTSVNPLQEIMMSVSLQHFSSSWGSSLTQLFLERDIQPNNDPAASGYTLRTRPTKVCSIWMSALSYLMSRTVSDVNTANCGDTDESLLCPAFRVASLVLEYSLHQQREGERVHNWKEGGLSVVWGGQSSALNNLLLWYFSEILFSDIYVLAFQG